MCGEIYISAFGGKRTILQRRSEQWTSSWKGTNACAICSKIPCIPERGRFCKENFLRYIDLCYVNPVYHRIKAFPLL